MPPIWKLLEDVFTVETIMTSEMLVWHEGMPLEPVRQEASELKADNIPVLKNGIYVGVLHLTQENAVSPLSDDWLLDANATIPQALSSFVLREKPALLVQKQGTVAGIVTPADFNKLPARTYFYNLLAAMEMSIADRIRNCFVEDQIRNILKSERVEKVMQRMEHHDLEIDIVHAMELADLLKVGRECPDLLMALNYSKNKFDNQLNTFDEFRNLVVHSNNLILDDRKGIDKLNKRVQRALEILELLNHND